MSAAGADVGAQADVAGPARNLRRSSLQESIRGEGVDGYLEYATIGAHHATSSGQARLWLRASPLERPVKSAEVTKYSINLRHLLAADEAARESGP